MIKHIVLWKLDASYSGEEKETLKAAVKEKLLNLGSQIGELQKINVFFNDEGATGANFDIMLDTEFNDLSALNDYQAHPAHLEVVAYIKSLKLQRAAIDYSF